MKLIGADALPDKQRITIESARLIKEAFLQQAAFSEVDSYCPLEKQLAMIDIILSFHEQALKASSEGKPVHQILSAELVEEIHRMKEAIPADEMERFTELKRKVEAGF